jgi:type IV secretory pathway VirB2 component (pilin)
VTTTANQRAGAAIAILAALGSSTVLLLGQVNGPIAVAIAVIGIVIGTGVARGMFSAATNSTK